MNPKWSMAVVYFQRALPQSLLLHYARMQLWKMRWACPLKCIEPSGTFLSFLISIMLFLGLYGIMCHCIFFLYVSELIWHQVYFIIIVWCCWLASFVAVFLCYSIYQHTLPFPSNLEPVEELFISRACLDLAHRHSGVLLLYVLVGGVFH